MTFSPANAGELLLEGVVEPAVEDGVRESRGHSNQVAEREADAGYFLVL